MFQVEEVEDVKILRKKKFASTERVKKRGSKKNMPLPRSCALNFSNTFLSL